MRFWVYHEQTGSNPGRPCSRDYFRLADYTSRIAAYDVHSFFAEVLLERFNSDCLPENLKEVPVPSLIGKQAVVVGAGMAGLAATRIPRGFLRARHRLENDALPKA